MRLSLIPGDDGFDCELARKATAFLDGKEVKHCRMADEEKGQVIIYKTDAGGFILTPDQSDIEQETKYGDVKIILGE